MGGRIDVENNHVMQLLDEQRIVRQLELPHAVGGACRGRARYAGQS